MENVLKIIVKVLTFLTFLAMLFFTGLALTLGPHWGLFVVCLLLSVGIGFFSYVDLRNYLHSRKQ